jgi:hypothetical protein
MTKPYEDFAGHDSNEVSNDLSVRDTTMGRKIRFLSFDWRVFSLSP